MKTTLLPQTLVFGSLLALATLAPRVSGQIFAVNGYDYSIREYSLGGAASVFAPPSAGLLSPGGLAFDSAGYLFVANNGHHTIEKFAPDGSHTVFANLDPVSASGLAFGGTNLFVASYGNGTIFKYAPDGSRTTFATGQNVGPSGMAFDTSGNLFVANGANNTITKFTPGGTMSVFADASDGLDAPVDLAFKNGLLYVVNFNGNTVLKFDANGNGSVFANTLLKYPISLAFDGNGYLYVENADSDGNNIAKFDANGNGSVLTTFLGVGFMAIKPECAPALMTIAQYAGVSVSGSIGCTYRIDYTTSLATPITWTPLVTNILTSNPFLFVDTNVVSGVRYYQAVSE